MYSDLDEYKSFSSTSKRESKIDAATKQSESCDGLKSESVRNENYYQENFSNTSEDGSKDVATTSNPSEINVVPDPLWDEVMQYIVPVPYDPNDPDLDWHKNFKDTSEDESEDGATSQQLQSFTKTKSKGRNVKHQSKTYINSSAKVRGTSRFAMGASAYNMPRSGNRNTIMERVNPPVQNVNATHPLGNNKTYYGGNGSNIDRCSVESTHVIPRYRKYQLLGDSQALRFAEQLLHCRQLVTHTSVGCRRLGYCVGGQKISYLEERLLKQEYGLLRNVIILIGTNDLVYGTPLKTMCNSFIRLLNAIKGKTDRIVILTVPPVPKLCNDKKHWDTLKGYNNFLIGCADERKIFAINIAPYYFGNLFSDDEVANEYFEPKRYNDRSRVDLMHLNRDGFKVLKSVLDSQYFDKFTSS